MKKQNKYTELCFACMKKTFGEPKRELGAITVSFGTCSTCNTSGIAIVPARDIYYAYEERITPEDWD